MTALERAVLKLFVGYLGDLRRLNLAISLLVLGWVCT